MELEDQKKDSESFSSLYKYLEYDPHTPLQKFIGFSKKNLDRRFSKISKTLQQMEDYSSYKYEKENYSTKTRGQSNAVFKGFDILRNSSFNTQSNTDFTKYDHKEDEVTVEGGTGGVNLGEVKYTLGEYQWPFWGLEKDSRFSQARKNKVSLEMGDGLFFSLERGNIHGEGVV